MDSNEPLRNLSRRQEKTLLKAAADLVRLGFENPERTGCPDSRTLRLLANRDPSVESSPNVIDHIGTCSPCFVEYSRYRSRHKLHTRLCYAVPSVLLMAGIVAWSVGAFSPRPAPTPAQQAAARPPEPGPSLEMSMTLDLRTRAVQRGVSNTTQTPQLLNRARLHVSVQLPVGSEEGAYEVMLADGTGGIVREAKGMAAFQGFIQVLPIQLDLVELPAGAYTLRIRREQGTWRDFDVRLE